MSPVSASDIAGKIELPAFKESVHYRQGKGMFETFDNDVQTRNYNLIAFWRN